LCKKKKFNLSISQSDKLIQRGNFVFLIFSDPHAQENHEESTSSEQENQIQPVPGFINKSPSARLPKTAPLSSHFRNIEVPFQAEVNHNPLQTRTNMNRTDALAVQPQSAFLNGDGVCSIPKQTVNGLQSPPIETQQQSFVILPQLNVNDPTVNMDMNSFCASSVPLSTRYQPLRSQHPGFDKYEPGVYEHDEEGTDVYNVLAETSPSGLQCTVTPNGTRIVRNSSSPELDLSAVSGLQCTLTPKGTRVVKNTNTETSKLLTDHQQQMPESRESRVKPVMSLSSADPGSGIPQSDSSPTDSSSSFSSSLSSPNVGADQFQFNVGTFSPAPVEINYSGHNPQIGLLTSTAVAGLNADQVQWKSSPVINSGLAQPSMSTTTSGASSPSVVMNSTNGQLNSRLDICVDARMTTPPCQTNVGLLKTNICPQQNRDAKPMGRGRGILALYRLVGGGSSNT
jgi:hypothetical protein